ncbi:MAG: BamA/TamA family outer membrane protein [Longimicrobiales bacterium]
MADWRCSAIVKWSCLFLLVAATPAAAQVDERAAPGDSCANGRISFVFLDNNSIFDTTDPDLDARFRWAYGIANSLHVRTRQWVIRRELLFAPGDCYDPYLLAESERLLRAYPFLAQVNVHGVPQPDGTHHVIVATHDDWSTRFDVRFRVDDGIALEGIRLTELNLLGMGQELGLFWFERDVRRDYGLTYWAPQIGRSRWDIGLAAGRTRAGSLFREEVRYPFVGEVGVWSGGQSYTRDDRFFDYIVHDAEDEASPRVLMQLREQQFNGTLVRRFGTRGRMWLGGLGLDIRTLVYPGDVEIAPDGNFDDRIPADSATVEAVRWQTSARDAVRVSLLFGRRDVRWIEVRGMDSMRGEEDFLLGTEFGLVAGKSIPSFGDDDLALTGLMYAAARPGNSLVAVRARGDALRLFDPLPVEDAWQDFRLEGDAFAYLRSSAQSRHLVVLRASGAGAWRTRTPFQLTLGGELGLRGYGHERFPGGRRVLLTAEDRIFLGWPMPGVMDVGATVFADAGRIWPGDAPFGADSDWRASAGLGLRISFPAGSRTTYRIDFAWPIETSTRLGDFRFRFSTGEPIGLLGAFSETQFRRSRPAGAAGQLFSHTNAARR